MAANADDLRVHFAHKIKQTTLLGVGPAPTQTTARLTPGRYLLKVMKPLTGLAGGGLADIVWVLPVSFDLGTITIVQRGLPAQGACFDYPEFPLDTSFSDGRIVTLHVLKNLNDRIQAVCLSGRATLAISLMGE
jgi:hypothetical protein